jgi:nicotinate-nucleotide adenylyltransferase
MKSEARNQTAKAPHPADGGHWGILGGAFDPVHNGHLTLASEIRNARQLDGVLLVPTFRHPTKGQTCRASFEDRFKMLKLAVSAYSWLQLSPIEKQPTPLSGYTLDTVLALKAAYSGATFYFIVGADNLGEMESWYKPEEVLAQARLLVGSRPNFDQKLLNSFPADRIEIIRTSLVDASSTEIRKLFASEPGAAHAVTLVPESVVQYITDKGLYR